MRGGNFGQEVSRHVPRTKPPQLEPRGFQAPATNRTYCCMQDKKPTHGPETLAQARSTSLARSSVRPYPIHEIMHKDKTYLIA